jgi:c-di-GMP-binding flagellar brake protein YcgR
MERRTSSANPQRRPNQAAGQERKTVARKLNRRIVIGLSDKTTLTGQTIDLSSGGVRIIIDRALPVPQECTIEFSILIEGQPQPISSRGRILSCVCTGMSGFSIGVQFVQMNDACKAVVARHSGAGT